MRSAILCSIAISCAATLSGEVALAQVPRSPVVRPKTVAKVPVTLQRFFAKASQPVYPFMEIALPLTLLSFPDSVVNHDLITIGGMPNFRKVLPASSPAHPRNANGSITINMVGYFARAGATTITIAVQLRNGTTLRETTTFVVAAPERYVFANTAELRERLVPRLDHWAIGSVCESEGDNPIGVVTRDSDLEIIIRGGPLDQHCRFVTKPWILPEGVRLVEMKWSGDQIGDRCDEARSVSDISLAEISSFEMTRGTTVVRTDGSQPVTDFFAFTQASNFVIDGVTFDKPRGPRSMIKACTLDMKCVSTVAPNTRFPLPTVDPQSFGYVLDRVVLEGPPGLRSQLAAP